MSQDKSNDAHHSKQIGYIHGYSEVEQDRLREQAEFMEYLVYRDINFSQVEHILEVGSGVGAQTQILLRRFPNLKVTGVDINDRQLAAANESLGKLDYAKGRYKFLKMNADKMQFEDNQFQGAFLCWILEHVKNPLDVLSEVRRVLKPGSRIFISEVMNFSFFLDPYCPSIWKFWIALNDQQYEQGGDPFVGVKLGTFLRDAGFADVDTNLRVLFADKREPEFRSTVITHWRDLMSSGADELLKEKRVTPELVA